MAHTYVVSSATYTPGVPGPDPLVTVVGSVDAVSCTVTAWLSYLQSLYTAAGGGVAGMTAVKNYIAPLMLAAAFPPAPASPTQLPTGTFTL